MKTQLVAFLAKPWSPAAAMLSGLAGALVLQHIFGWMPCPLCVIQRLTAIGLFFALVAFALVRSRAVRLAALSVAGLLAITGAVAAAAHLWILFSPQTGSCGPGVARFVMHLVDSLPGSEWLLEGSGACEDARYQVLGLPLPAWAGALHLICAAWAIFLARSNRAGR